MASTMWKPPDPRADWYRDLDPFFQVMKGNVGARVALLGYDGVERNPIGGAVLSSGNFALDVMAANANQARFRSSGGSALLTLTDTSVLATAPIDAASGIRSSGSSTPASGAGIEVTYGGGTGTIASYNRGTSSYTPLVLRSSTLSIQNSAGAAMLAHDGTVLQAVAPLDASAGLRASGTTTPSTGAGIELTYSAGAGTIASYNRGTAAYTPLVLRSQTLSVQNTAGLAMLSHDGVNVTFPTGQVLLPNGAVAVPSLSFTSDPNTGLYWASADRLYVAAGGVKVAEFAQAAAGSLFGVGVAPSVGLHVSKAQSADFVTILENTAASGYGLKVNTTSTSSGDVILDLFANNVAKFYVQCDGSVVVGAPTGGGRGSGTINAQAAYDDSVLLTDHLLDLWYDGRVRPEDEARYGTARLWTIAETERFTRAHRHLPTMPGRAEWEADGSRSLGELVTHLWATVEQLQMHIFELDERLAAAGG